MWSNESKRCYLLSSPQTRFSQNEFEPSFIFFWFYEYFHSNKFVFVIILYCIIITSWKFCYQCILMMQNIKSILRQTFPLYNFLKTINKRLNQVQGLQNEFIWVSLYIGTPVFFHPGVALLGIPTDWNHDLHWFQGNGLGFESLHIYRTFN